MKRSTFPLNVLRGFLLLSLTPMFLPGQNSSYRPGTIDPSGNPRNLTLFRDEQIYSMGLPSAAGNPWRSATVSFDGSLADVDGFSAILVQRYLVSGDQCTGCRWTHRPSG